MRARRFFSLGNLLEYVGIVLNMIGVGLIFLVALWIGVDVTGRVLFNHPIAGTPEIVKTATVAIAFLCFFYTLRQGRHVRSDILERRLPEAAKKATSILRNILGAAVFAILARYAWDSAWAGYLVGEWEGMVWRIPVYPSRFVIVLGSFLLSIQYILYLARDVRLLVAPAGDE